MFLSKLVDTDAIDKATTKITETITITKITHILMCVYTYFS